MPAAMEVLAWVTAVLAALVTAAYFYMTRRFGHWRKKGVPELKPVPFLGNMKEVAFFRKSIGLQAKQIYEENRDLPYVGLYAFDEPLLQIHDLDLIKAVLVKDFASFPDRSFHASETRDPLMGKSLFSMKGESWKKARTVFGPSFTSGKMKKMYSLVERCGKTLAVTLQREAAGEKATEVYEILARYTTDVISTTAFGIDGRTLENPRSDFRRMLRRFFDLSPLEGLKWAATFLTPRLMDHLRVKLLKVDVDNYFLDVIADTMAQRNRDGVRRNDFLDSIIHLQRTGGVLEDDDVAHKQHKKATREEEEEVTAQAFMVLAAGFETSATTMSYALFELARLPHLQRRLRDEIVAAVDDDGGVPYDALMGLKYLDMVVQETMRKYPPLPFLDRVSSRPYTLPGTQVHLEKGSRVLIPVFGIQHDARHYPDPLRFDPERFADDARRARHPMAHMPFGEGPRICAGSRFANMQLKCGLVHVLKTFSVHICSESPKEMSYRTFAFLLLPEPFHLCFKKL